MLLTCSPKSLEVEGSGGCLVGKDFRIEFDRMAWYFIPLELAGFLGMQVPPKESTAGSASRSFFFRIHDGSPEVLYSHDFELNSPMFRS